MSDLISRADAIEHFNEIADEDNTDFALRMYLVGVVNDIKALPSAEAVDVVWCKDCRYRKKVGTSYYCELDEFNVEDEDFCSWGERRE